MEDLCSINAQFPCKAQITSGMLLHYSVLQFFLVVKKTRVTTTKNPTTPQLFKFTQNAEQDLQKVLFDTTNHHSISCCPCLHRTKLNVFKRSARRAFYFLKIFSFSQISFKHFYAVLRKFLEGIWKLRNFCTTYDNKTMGNFILTFSYEISNLTSSTLGVLSDNFIPLSLPENRILIFKKYLNIF